MFRIADLKGRERGQNFVEIVIILPIIMLVFLGMIEIGWAAHAYVVVVNAAREGARFGSRGVHVSVEDIAYIVETAMKSNLELDFDGEDVNTTIIVTQIDIDEDGEYRIYDQGVRGDLPVSSAICEPSQAPCNAQALDLQEFIEANDNFNSLPGLCQDNEGCYGDFILVEVFHLHESAIFFGFTREFIPFPFPVNARTIMRILHRRAPTL